MNKSTRKIKQKNEIALYFVAVIDIASLRLARLVKVSLPRRDNQYVFYKTIVFRAVGSLLLKGWQIVSCILENSTKMITTRMHVCRLRWPCVFSCVDYFQSNVQENT